MSDTLQKRAEALFSERGTILKADVLREHGIYNRCLAGLVNDGLIRKLKTGYYIWNEAETELTDIETAAALVPFGVVCLQSAALFHALTMANPLAVTIAIPANRTRVALPQHPPIELVAYPLPTFDIGITTGSGGFRVYDRERTVCDFFRKRKQIGEDLALEALRAYMNGARNLQYLFDYAEKLRVKNIIKPYVEALL